MVPGPSNCLQPPVNQIGHSPDIGDPSRPLSTSQYLPTPRSPSGHIPPLWVALEDLLALEQFFQAC